MNKKKGVILSLYLTVFCLFSNFVLAAEDPNILGAFARLLGPVFEKFSIVGFSGNLDAEAAVYAKIIIWLFVFTVFYFASSKVFKDAGRGVQIMAPLILSIMSVLLIPNTMIIKLFQTYSVVVSIVIWAIPIIAIWYLNNKIFNKDDSFSYLGKILTYGTLIFLMLNMNDAFKQTELLKVGISEYLDWLYLIFIIGFVWNLIDFFRSIGGAKSMVGNVKEAVVGKKELEDEDEETKKEKEESEKEKELDMKLMNIQKREVEANKRIIDDLKKLKNLIKKYGTVGEGRRLISEKIEQIKPEVAEVERLEKLTENYTTALDNITKQELYNTNKKLKSVNTVLNCLKKAGGVKKEATEDITKLKSYADKELNKVKNELGAVNDGIKKLQEEVKAIEGEFINNLTKAINDLNAGNNNLAVAYIDKAIDNKKSQDKKLKESRWIERKLKWMQNHELNDLKNTEKLSNIVKRELGKK